MTAWSRLRETLDASAERGEAIRFWWRDDDAGRPAPALERLLDLAARLDAPVALAVVPDWLEPDVEAVIGASHQATVLQHGITHRNHAPDGEKPVELGYRPVAALLGELQRARHRLLEAFGSLFVAILVPPWNRIDPALTPDLGRAGYIGLSTFGRRQRAAAAPGVVQLNTHLDPVDWRGSYPFVGADRALDQLQGAVEGAIEDADEPIGLLTHHLVMDEAGWDFHERLLDLLGRHPGARLCRLPDLVGSGR